MLMIFRSLVLRLERNGGQVDSCRDGWTLICQKGSGVVLPIVEDFLR